MKRLLKEPSSGNEQIRNTSGFDLDPAGRAKTLRIRFLESEQNSQHRIKHMTIPNFSVLTFRSTKGSAKGYEASP